MRCARPGCNNELKTGKTYCGQGCAARDRKRMKREALSVKEYENIPDNIKTLVLMNGGSPEVLEQMNIMLETETVLPPLVDSGHTLGDWVLSWDGNELRPTDALSYDKIQDMLKCGAVKFALEMKIAGVISPFRNDTGWMIRCPDEELMRVVEANLRQILPKMMMDILFSSLAYGVSFQELIWEKQTGFQLGLSEEANGTEFTVAKVPNSVNPETVREIKRDSQYKFDGFVQRNTHLKKVLKPEIDVTRDSALVIPYNERFRNLWGESFLKPIYPLWFWYEVVLRAMVRFMQRQATPVTVVKAPGKGNVLKPGKNTQVNTMVLGLAIAGNAAHSNALVIPSDVDPDTKTPLWDIFYLKAEQGTQPFISVLEYLTQEMMKAALAGDRAMSQPSQGVGSKGLGEVHAQFTQLHNELILDQVLMYLNLYFLPKFSLYNKGLSGPPVWLETQGLDPTERDQMIKLMTIAGNSQSFQEFFYMVDWRRLAESNSIPTLTEEEMDELKTKLNEEALQKQKDFQDVQIEAQKNMVQPPSKKEAGSLDKSGQAKKVSPTGQIPKPPVNGNTAKSEYEQTVEVLLGAERIPITLSVDELEMLNSAGVFNEESVKLFNPFHSRADGKFTSHPGGVGAGGESTGGQRSVADVKSDTIKKASTLGRVVKTTGKVLGLTGLGVVGLVIVASVASADGPQITPGMEDNVPGDPEKLAETNRKLEELTKNWPKFNSPEQAVDYISNQLESVGITDIPPGLKVSVGGSSFAEYDYATNTVKLSPSAAKALTDGSPNGVWSITHEIAHSAQELSHETGQAWGDGSEFGPEILNDEIYRQNLEGQNDLVSAVTMSQIYDRPMSQETSAELDAEFYDLRKDQLFYEMGITSNVEQTTGTVGYPVESAYWAGVSTAMAQTQGGTPMSNLITSHDRGFDPQYTHNILVNLFPEQMSEGGFYVQTEEGGILGIGATTVTNRRFPPPAQVERWLEEQYNINADSAYAQMLIEAAQEAR